MERSKPTNWKKVVGQGLQKSSARHLPKKKSNNATKHIPKKQAPVGAKKDGKMKVLDGQTQTVRWRQGKAGFVRDYDGDPISAAKQDTTGIKERKTHTVHEGRKPRKAKGVE